MDRELKAQVTWSKYELSSEKCKIVEDNMNLVWWVINEKFKFLELTSFDKEDLFQIGCIGLIKAVVTYDSKKGKLATYAVPIISNEIRILIRKSKRESIFSSLDQEIMAGEDGSSLTLGDTMGVEEWGFEIVEFKVMFSELYPLLEKCLNDDDRKVLKLYVQGMTQKEIGQMLNESQSYVSRRIIAIKEKVRIVCNSKGIELKGKKTYNRKKAEVK